MKKVVSIAFLGLILTAVLASCGSAQHGHCDAYGDASINTPTELPDISE